MEEHIGSLDSLMETTSGGGSRIGEGKINKNSIFKVFGYVTALGQGRKLHAAKWPDPTTATNLGQKRSHAFYCCHIRTTLSLLVCCPSYTHHVSELEVGRKRMEGLDLHSLGLA